MKDSICCLIWGTNKMLLILQLTQCIAAPSKSAIFKDLKMPAECRLLSSQVQLPKIVFWSSVRRVAFSATLAATIATVTLAIAATFASVATSLTSFTSVTATSASSTSCSTFQSALYCFVLALSVIILGFKSDCVALTEAVCIGVGPEVVSRGCSLWHWERDCICHCNL